MYTNVHLEGRNKYLNVLFGAFFTCKTAITIGCKEQLL